MIAASMAEIASAYPTAGGLYYWSSRMKNKDWAGGPHGSTWPARLRSSPESTSPRLVRQLGDCHSILSNFNIAYGNGSMFLGTLVSGQLVTMAVLLLIQLASTSRASGSWRC